MGKLSKTRGTGYENRIVKWFKNEQKKENQPEGWTSERNILSKEEKSFGKTTAKHDVKAWKDVSNNQRIFLQIEAKKTAKEIHTIQKEWIDKIDWTKDELLVIALARTQHYAVLDIDVLPDLFGIDDSANNQVVIPSEVFISQLLEKACKHLKCRGNKSVRIHKEDLECATVERPVIMNWENIDRCFCIFPLLDYVKLREQRPPNAFFLTETKCNQEDNNADIPIVSTDVRKETTIACPYDGLPIRLVPNKK